MEFKSYTEPTLDAGHAPIAHDLLGVTGYSAQQEALRVFDRTTSDREAIRRNRMVLRVTYGFELWTPE